MVFSAGFLLILIGIFSTIISFRFVKPKTRIITNELNLQLKRLINIPDGLNAGTSYNNNNFSWEMETPRKEIVKVNFNYDPAYPKYKDKITNSLEMEEGGDPTVFNKVLPAIIRDDNLLEVIKESANTKSCRKEGLAYSGISLVCDNSGRVIKILWKIDKSSLKDRGVDYSLLSPIPDFALERLYNLYDFVRDALKD